MKGRMKRALKDRKGDRAPSVCWGLHRRTLPCLLSTTLVRPDLSAEISSRFYAFEERGEPGERPELR